MAGLKRALLEDEEHRHPAIRLGELRDHGVGVYCQCHRCGHSPIIEASRFIAEFGADLPVAEIGAFWRCSSCGSKDVATQPARATPVSSASARHAPSRD